MQSVCQETTKTPLIDTSRKKNKLGYFSVSSQTSVLHAKRSDRRKPAQCVDLGDENGYVMS